MFLTFISFILQKGTENMSVENISPKNARADARAWLAPIWSGNTVFCETGMFVGDSDAIPLLFSPEKILLVTSYDGLTAYEEGVDFVLRGDGKIALTQGSKIPVISPAEYFHDKESPKPCLKTMNGTKEVYTYWGDYETMTRWQICVTYTHNGTPNIPVPPCRSDRYAEFLSKLEKGEDVTVLTFGDSIAHGYTCSFVSNVHPFAPSWSMMAVNELARRYEYTVRYVETGLYKQVKVPKEDLRSGDRGIITYVNTSVGGWNTNTAIEHFEERIAEPIKKYGCDLFILAFGMNDGRKTPDEFCGKLRTILDQTFEIKDGISLLLVSTMLPNGESTNGWYKNQHLFEDAMIPLADGYFSRGIPASVAPVTSMSRFVCSRKRFRDHSGNNINHPNDFMIRIYTQTILQTLAGLD